MFSLINKYYHIQELINVGTMRSHINLNYTVDYQLQNI